ncbi:MAG: Na+/H+ antiporter NhaA [Gammaproteobacteria bacterium]|nr:MAG: Na+/H+ antiporter NhaA [Gammaproteobacteria bacterium]
MQAIRKFFQSEIAGGVVLAIAAILAMIIANTPLYDYYHHLLEVSIGVHVDDFVIDKHALHWINDGLMAIFFFLVGLELKREMLVGELSEVRKVILPALAAVGGMVIPGLIYAAMNWSNPDYLNGWAIPAATDIAFALGVISLLGNRVPASLKIFLATIAIFDDIGAILIIAFFYSHGLSLSALSIAAVALAILFVLNRLNVTRITPYILIGIVMWAAVLKSGIHATIAGVLLALCIPMWDKDDEEHSPLEDLEHDLQDAVAFVILPIFAFANAGINLTNAGISDIVHPVPMAITAGLFLGKPIGVMLFSWVGVKLGLASIPKGITWHHIFGVSLLCGIGFTMSLFIGGLAFGGIEKAFDERLGIIIGSLLSGIAGYIYLNIITKKSKHLDLTK